MLSIILFIVKIILVMVGIGCVVGSFYDFKYKEWKNKPSKLLFVGILCIFIFVSSMCIDFIPANNVGVKWSLIGGTSDKTLNEGIVLKTPLDKIYTIPTTVQERTMKDITVQTKDAQFLTMEVNVKFSVNKENAFNIMLWMF